MQAQLCTSEGLHLSKLPDDTIISSIIFMYRRLALVQTYNINEQVQVQGYMYTQHNTKLQHKYIGNPPYDIDEQVQH